jgi:hypothetical protein
VQSSLTSETPEVSVIVPLYNKAKTIFRAIDSVLAQDFTDFELIIVDDGSTDGSAELVGEKTCDRRITLVSQSNAGPGAARNVGAALARGRLLTFLDADDEWRPNLLTVATAKLRAHPDCAAFTAAFMLEPQHQNRWSKLSGFSEGTWAITPDIELGTLTDCIAAFHACTAVYRRETFSRLGGFYAEDRCTLGEDVYLWILIALNSPIYRHTLPLGTYHTADSELGIGGRPSGQLPLEPVLTNPSPIYAQCPPELHNVLDIWLAQHARRAAAMQLERGNCKNAAFLLKHFPIIKEAFPISYFKLRIRMLAPEAWNRLARMKRLS